MSLTEYAFQKKQVIWFLCLLILIGGMVSFFQLGQLEDPEFTVKTAVIHTQYPGASARQVELEVTDRLETKLQEMTEVKHVYSISRPGLSIIKVDIKNEYWADRLPQVWDILRKKVRDVEGQLPPGAQKPVVGDDFGFVFGFLLAITSDGFSYDTLENYSKDLRKELSLIPGVARIDLWGTQQKQVSINVSQTQLSQLGITPKQLVRILQQQNLVVNAGQFDVQSQRFRVVPGGEFKTAAEIADLVIGGGNHTLQGKQGNPGNNQQDALIRIRDIGEVKVTYVDPPKNRMFYNGKPAIGIAIAPASGVNVVQVGQLIDKKLSSVNQFLPIGIEVNKISWQSDIVQQSVQAFMINLVEAILIVLLVLALTMGVRAGLIIGMTGLLMPILTTFIMMNLLGIDLQRVSLGAMIIAMGMMVDNAIVVVDGYLVKVKQGMKRSLAAIEAARQPSWPLLGATLVACLAFYPIFASTYDTGEYARSLFQVVAISLLSSWILSVLVTPMVCVRVLSVPVESGQTDVYQGSFYQRFRAILQSLLQYRWLFLIGMTGLLILSAYMFRFVPQEFFPDSSRTQLMIDYWAPQGTNIQSTEKGVRRIEKQLQKNQQVTGVATFVGQGPPRFYLPVNPEDNYPSYAQLIVNVASLPAVDAVMAQTKAWVDEHIRNALVRVRKYGVGAFDDWKIEIRVSGPAEANMDTLRQISSRILKIANNQPGTLEARTNWRDRVYRIELDYDQNRARWLGLSRQDIANALLRSNDGVQVGQYREKDDLIPIIIRSEKAQRQNAVDSIDTIQVRGGNDTQSTPLSQVITNVLYQWEDPIIQRWDRRRAITIQASPKSGVTATQLREQLLAKIEQIKLPPGYTIEWDGEYDSSKQSVAALIPGLLPAVTMMLFIIIALFNAYRPMAIIVLLIPFVLIGISFGLLMTQVPFGFIALLGAMSLSGMMVKNAVVLLDQSNINLEAGMTRRQAIIESAVSRLRPVMNATATTVLGMLPLLQDVFWISLAVTIIFGLAFGFLITMLLLPVLYAIFYQIDQPDQV